MEAPEVTVQAPPAEDAAPHKENAGETKNTKPNGSSSSSGGSSSPKSPTPISSLAALAADAGRKLQAQPPPVFEGSGKVGAPGSAASSPKPGSSSLHGAASPVVGGVRVMPAADDEMRRILAERLRKSE